MMEDILLKNIKEAVGTARQMNMDRHKDQIRHYKNLGYSAEKCYETMKKSLEKRSVGGDKFVRSLGLDYQEWEDDMKEEIETFLTHIKQEIRNVYGS